MCYTLILMIISRLFWLPMINSEAPVKGAIAFRYMTRDSVLLDIYEYRDSTDILEGYTSHIVTPVCEDQLCYDAELDLYWDILGNFSHFDVASEKPLTKNNHVPFDQSDYKLLRKILLTKSPSFIHLWRNELIIKSVSTDSTQADGMTGATTKAVKKDMVEGAAFTCYTLWHIANGGIAFEIQEYTKKKLDENVARKLLVSQKAEAHYFLIENTGEYFPDPEEVVALLGLGCDLAVVDHP